MGFRSQFKRMLIHDVVELGNSQVLEVDGVDVAVIVPLTEYSRLKQQDRHSIGSKT